VAHHFAYLAQLFAPRPCGAALRSCGSPPSHLAGVGQCPPAIGQGCLVGLLAGVLDRRPVSPLPSTSARNGAGSGWHSRGQIADSTMSTVYLEGLAPGGAGLCPCAFSWAVTVTVLHIASDARLHRSRGYRTERGLSAGPAPLRMRSRPSWHPARAGPIGGPVMHDTSSSRQSRWAAVGPPLNRPVTCSLSAGGAAAGLAPGYHRVGCCLPGRRAVPGLGAPDLRRSRIAFTQVTIHFLFARKVPARRQPNSGPSPLYR
jgi:hypothetical protein